MGNDLPGYNIELVKKRIRELQEKYEKEIKPNEKEYNEQNTKKDFIEPILRVLNWDTESKNEVDAEFCIKNRRSSGSADYALKINGEVKLLLEAKSFDKDLETGYDIIHGQKRTYVEQLVGYAFDLNRHMKTKIDYCILTNGKEWRIYNVQWQGVAFDKKLVFLIKIEEFLTKFRKFWSLEKGNVSKGDIDRFVVEEDKVPIDRKAVSSLLYCKNLLIDSIVKDYEKNKRDMKYMIAKIINKPLKDAPNGFPKFYEMSEDERLNKFILEASSKIINKILFIRIIEDKGYLKPKLTKKSVEEWKSWFSQADRILRLFREACHEADEQYNGGIFDFEPYDELSYDNEVLDKIMGILGDFNFEEIDADVIGRIYEIYLGTILSFEEEIRGKKRTKLSADYTERKKLGQYYTPKFVVDFIVKNTLGKLLEGKTPEEVSKIKVLDPACGSGSFLIRAFDYLKDYYVRYNDMQISKLKKKGLGNMNNYIKNGEIIDYNHKILKENLHGVDLNALSTQICSINLWLRALEKDKKLGKLSKNILHGNSLISGVEDKEELTKYKAELKEIAKLREKIKDCYGRKLNKKEQDELEKMETKLRELRNKINVSLNENLKEYFDNLDLVYPFNWEVEYTEVFDPDKSKEEQGFDVVIGNPPYVAWDKISDRIFFEEGKFQNMSYACRPNHKDAQPNLYLFFIVKNLNLCKNYFSFILPQEWLYHNYAQDFRNFILDKAGTLLLLQFNPQLKVFKNPSEIVGTNSCILLIDMKDKSKKFTHIYLDELDESKVEKIVLNEGILDKASEKMVLDFKNLYNKPWIFASNELQTIKDKITKLKDIIYLKNKEYFEVCGGFQPPINRIKEFEINESEFESLSNKEKELVHRAIIDASEIKRYLCYDKKRYWIVANEINSEAELRNSFPHLYKALSKKVIQKKKDYWWHFPNIRNHTLIKKYDIKLLSPRTSERNSFFIDTDKSVIKGTNSIIFSKKLDSYYLAAILNSKLSDFWCSKFGYEYHGGKTKKFEPDKIRKYSLPIKIPEQPESKITKELIGYSKKISMLKYSAHNIILQYTKVLNNQPIPDERACKFAHYWDSSNYYDFSKDTIPFANKTKAKILDLDIKEEGEKLLIYMTNISLAQNKKFDNIKIVELTIKNEMLRKFLYYSLKKYINEKRGKGFGSGIILEVIKKIPIPVYVANVKQNLNKIKKVMDEFKHETKNLWKIDSKTYQTLTEIEDDIEKTDKEIDEMVYDLYGISEKEET